MSDWSPNTTGAPHLSDSEPLLPLQDSDEGEEDEELALQSGSEGTSSEPREDHTDASSVEVTSSRPRRAATLRRAFSAANTTGSQEVPEGRRRSTRSLSAYNQNNKYQPPKGQDMQVQTERRHTDGGSTLTVVSNKHVSCLVIPLNQWIDEKITHDSHTYSSRLSFLFFLHFIEQIKLLSLNKIHRLMSIDHILYFVYYITLYHICPNTNLILFIPKNLQKYCNL